MARKWSLILWAGCLVGATALPGCDGPPPPPAGDPVQLTPGMENMKAEMLKSYNASKGKGPGRGFNPAPK